MLAGNGLNDSILKKGFLFMDDLLRQALDEIDNDPTLTPKQKLSHKAKAMADARIVNNKAAVTRGYANRTGFWRMFSLSVARAMGRGIGRMFGGR